MKNIGLRTPWTEPRFSGFNPWKWLKTFFELMVYGMKRWEHQLLTDAVSLACQLRLSVLEITGLYNGTGFSEMEEREHPSKRRDRQRCTVYIVPKRGMRIALDLPPKISIPERVVITTFPEMHGLAISVQSIICNWTLNLQKQILGPQANLFLDSQIIIAEPGDDRWTGCDPACDVPIEGQWG